jgi:hypothetical protein
MVRMAWTLVLLAVFVPAVEAWNAARGRVSLAIAIPLIMTTEFGLLIGVGTFWRFRQRIKDNDAAWRELDQRTGTSGQQ